MHGGGISRGLWRIFVGFWLIVALAIFTLGKEQGITLAGSIANIGGTSGGVTVGATIDGLSYFQAGMDDYERVRQEAGAPTQNEPPAP